MNRINKKIKLKLNAFDIFVFLLVLCLIASVGYKIYASLTEEKNSKNASIYLHYECDGEYNSVMRYLNDGDALYLESGELLGYITQVGNDGMFTLVTSDTVTEETITEVPSEAVNGDMQAENTEIIKEGYTYESVKFKGVLKLNGNAIKSNKGSYYKIGDRLISVGGVLLVHTEKTEFSITVSELSEIDRY